MTVLGAHPLAVSLLVALCRRRAESLRLIQTGCLTRLNGCQKGTERLGPVQSSWTRGNGNRPRL
jgi:hypothetical protein